MTAVNDGRNPDWPADSVMVGLWEAVFAEHDLSAVQVGRLRLALDDLADALELLDESVGMADRDRIAAVAGVRAARKAARDLIAELTGDKRDPRGGHNRKDGPVHGHRSKREKSIRQAATEIDTEE